LPPLPPLARWGQAAGIHCLPLAQIPVPAKEEWPQQRCTKPEPLVQRAQQVFQPLGLAQLESWLLSWLRQEPWAMPVSQRVSLPAPGMPQ